MEYCLSTVNEFLNDIRTFQTRAHDRKSNSGLWTDSSDQDDEINTDNTSLAPSLNVNELVRGFVRQLLQALLALHEHSIVHCDVKGDNIFIANDKGQYIVKLGVSLFGIIIEKIYLLSYQDFNLSHRLELESPSASASDSRSTQFGTLCKNYQANCFFKNNTKCFFRMTIDRTSKNITCRSLSIDTMLREISDKSHRFTMKWKILALFQNLKIFILLYKR
jgi:hypothetical protein